MVRPIQDSLTPASQVAPLAKDHMQSAILSYNSSNSNSTELFVPPILKSSSLGYYSSSGDEDLDPVVDIDTSDGESISSSVHCALRRQYIRSRSKKRGKSK